MIGKTGAWQLGGASMLAIMAASVMMPSEARACQATSGADQNGDPIVGIACDPDDLPVAPFTTRYVNASGILISTGNGNDALTMTGGAIVDGAAGTPGVDIDTSDFLDPSDGIVEMLGGNDIVIISGGQIGSPQVPVSLSLGDGTDTFNMSGGRLDGSVFGGAGDDDIEVSGNAVITGVPGFSAAIETGAGNNEVRILGGTIGTDPTQLAIFLEDGANIFDMSGGAVNGNIVGQGGGNSYTLSGGVIDGFLSAGSGNDTVLISGGTITGDVSGEGGNDTITVSGGSIGSTVAGNDGTDTITVAGGSIAGDVEAETVILTGGSIGGNIVGITRNTLVINDSLSPAPLDLRNGVVFSGTNAAATIINTDLAAGGTKTQVFSGFDSVTAVNSTIAFGASVIDIGRLNLTNGSTLFVNGNVDPDFVSVTNSTISLIDGAANDVFTLGGLALNNVTLGFDVDQRTSTADRIVATTLSTTGTNIVNVNLLGAPVFAGQTDIPIIVSGGPVAGTFVAQGLPGTQASLFTYQVLAGAGGLFIRITPTNVGLALATQNAVDISTIETALDALYGINRDAIDADLRLANGADKVMLSPSFGVFASGQLAHTEHDGFTISGAGLTGDGPSFGADDFSAAISLDFDAAKHFSFDQEYGLNLGLFAGYASTDVNLDSFLGFDAIGDATNRAGMIGGYGLFRKEYNYALVSATTFLGHTDIFNGVLNASGDYSTQGYAVTGSVGHIFKLSDTMRFDLRGGLIGVTFRGDDYADGNGNQYGGSEISFGAVKFEPGIYMDRQLENGMIFSPYARADLQQRFGYTNTASLDGVEFDFDDADFSAALLTGFNLKVSKSTTVSGEIRGKMSADSQTIAGKFGLKYQF